MKNRLVAIWQLAVATLLYPLTFAGLIWVWWTGRSIVWGLVIVAVLLLLDRSWLFLLRRMIGLGRDTKKRPRRDPPGR